MIFIHYIKIKKKKKTFHVEGIHHWDPLYVMSVFIYIYHKVNQESEIKDVVY